MPVQLPPSVIICRFNCPNIKCGACLSRLRDCLLKDDLVWSVEGSVEGMKRVTVGIAFPSLLTDHAMIKCNDWITATLNPVLRSQGLIGSSDVERVSAVPIALKDLMLKSVERCPFKSELSMILPKVSVTPIPTDYSDTLSLQDVPLTLFEDIYIDETDSCYANRVVLSISSLGYDKKSLFTYLEEIVEAKDRALYSPKSPLSRHFDQESPVVKFISAEQKKGYLKVVAMVRISSPAVLNCISHDFDPSIAIEGMWSLIRPQGASTYVDFVAVSASSGEIQEFPDVFGDIDAVGVSVTDVIWGSGKKVCRVYCVLEPSTSLSSFYRHVFMALYKFRYVPIPVACLQNRGRNELKCGLISVRTTKEIAYELVDSDTTVRGIISTLESFPVPNSSQLDCEIVATNHHLNCVRTEGIRCLVFLLSWYYLPSSRAGSVAVALPIIIGVGWKSHRWLSSDLHLNMESVLSIASLMLATMGIVQTMAGSSATESFGAAIAVLGIASFGFVIEAVLQLRVAALRRSVIRNLLDRSDVCHVPLSVLGASYPSDFVSSGMGILVPHKGVFITDGYLESTTAECSELYLTGELEPVRKVRGSPIYAGSMNLAGDVSFIASCEPHFSGLHTMEDNLTLTGASNVEVGTLPVFALRLFSISAFIAVASFFGWIGHEFYSTGKITLEGSMFAFNRCASVFAITCPCAFGLSRPMALMMGTLSAAYHYHSILQSPAKVFSMGSDPVSDLVIDKTGTLTRGESKVIAAVFGFDCLVPDPLSGKLIEIQNDIIHLKEEHLSAGICKRGSEFWTAIAFYMRSAQSGNLHPVARGILECSNSYLSGTPLQDHSIDGTQIPISRGVLFQSDTLNVKMSEFNEQDYQIPGEHKVQVQRIVERARLRGFQVIGVQINGKRIAALLIISDPLRSDALQFISMLHRKQISVTLATGDRSEAARTVGDALGIPRSNIATGLSPNGKLKLVDSIKAKATGRVVMLGDGLNDCQALKAADFGIAIGRPNELTSVAADLIYLGHSLTPILSILSLISDINRCSELNIAWATVFNLVGIPAAAGMFARLGLVPGPALCSMLMASSSIIITLHSLSLYVLHCVMVHIKRPK